MQHCEADNEAIELITFANVEYWLMAVKTVELKNNQHELLF